MPPGGDSPRCRGRSDERTKQALFIVEPNQRRLSAIAGLLEARQLRPQVSDVVSFAQAGLAYARSNPRSPSRLSRSSLPTDVCCPGVTLIHCGSGKYETRQA